MHSFFHNNLLDNSLSKSVIMELPFILVFMLMMGSENYVLSLFYSLSYSHLINSFSRLSIWLLFSCLFAYMIFKANRRFFKISLYLILFSLFAIQHYLLQNFGSPISPTYLTLLAETNKEEVSNFARLYLSLENILPTIKILSLYVIIAFLGEYIWTRFIRKHKVPVFYSYLTSVFLVPLLVFGLYSSRVYYQVLNETSPDRVRMLGCPEDFISSTFSSIQTIILMNRNLDDAVNNTLSIRDITHSEKSDSSLNIILIIGESYCKWHSSLYGYEKNTSPLMQKEKESGRLFVFNNVLSPSNSTSVVLKNLLSCNCYSEGEGWYSKPFLPAIFNNAGYNVYMWDNQRLFDPGASLSFTLNGYLYNDAIASSSYTECNSEIFPFDEDLVASFCDRVGVSSCGFNLIIFHLIGQHFDAMSRYPHNQQFEYFTADSISRNDPWIDTTMKRHIAEYDNATLYNDYVIDKVTNLYRDTNSFLVYLSDHGEEVYDYRDYIGRDQGSLTKEKIKYQYEIPFFVWTSTEYADRHPEVLLSLKNSVDRPYMSDLVPHMLMSIAGINSPYYVSKYDLLSSDYKYYPRVSADSKTEFDSFIFD